MTPFIARLTAAARIKRNRMAEMIADGATLKASGAAVGLSERGSGDAWAAIKRGLGGQAV